MGGKDEILLIAMGGTVDGEGGIVDGVFKDEAISYRNESHLPDYLKEFGIEGVNVETVAQKHSTDLTEGDLAKMLDMIDGTEEQRIIVSQGTGTLLANAEYIRDKKVPGSQTIVLFGSERPIMGFSPTDAPLYLGMALEAMENNSGGVYICEKTGTKEV